MFALRSLCLSSATTEEDEKGPLGRYWMIGRIQVELHQIGDEQKQHSKKT